MHTPSELKVEFQPAFHPGGCLEISGFGGEFIALLHVQNSHYQKEFSDEAVIAEKDLNECFDYLDDHISEIRNYENQVGLDGIAIDLWYKKENINMEAHLWSPRERAAPALFLISLLKSIVDQFERNETVNYIESLMNYVSDKPIIRTISQSDSNATLRISGNLSSSMESDIGKVLNDIAADKDVTIDMRNFAGMGTILYRVFRKYLDQNHRTQWNASISAFQQLAEIGVPFSNISVIEPESRDELVHSAGTCIQMAIKGEGISISDAASAANASPTQIEMDLRRGTLDEEQIKALAPLANLNAEVLLNLPTYRPTTNLPEWCLRLPTSEGHFTRNTYLLSIEDLIMVDPAMTYPAWTYKKIEDRYGKQPDQIWVTDCHGSATKKLSPWRKTSWHGHPKANQTFKPIPALVETIPLAENKKFTAALYLEYSGTRICFTGPILTAGSICHHRDYRQAKHIIKERILSLPQDTILCPRVGPVTSVWEEIQNNPFFAA